MLLAKEILPMPLQTFVPMLAAGEADSAVPPRPFGLLTWSLPLGQLDLASLGWSNEHGLPVVSPVQPAATPSSAAKRVVAAAKGAKGEGGGCTLQQMLGFLRFASEL